jgi:CubicO group peptidase (beta-lactamase class C family)
MITFFAAGLLAAQPAPASQAVAESLIEQTGSPGAAAARVCADAFEEGVAGVRIAGGDAPIEPGDLWHMGSNTKAMTATLTARLVEQGVIGWDTPISEGLSGLDLEIAEALRAATLEELLSHRAGLQANAGLFATLRLAGSDDERDAAADRLTYARAVLSEPGGPRGGYLYSNAGYVIAAVMLERAAGEPYEALMQREVFGPLGMAGTGWGPPGERGRADQPRGHAGALFGGLDAREPGARADNPPAMNPAGRAHLPLESLMAFLVAHRDQPADYLSAESWERLHTPVSGGDYALGWGVRSDGSLVHAGSNTMWFARMLIDEESGCALAVAVNDGRIDAVSAPVNAALEALAGRGGD